MMNRIRLVAVGLLVLLMVIVVLQNTEAVETRLLFFSITMPRAALLFGALAIGFSSGVLVSNRILDRGSAVSETAEDPH